MSAKPSRWRTVWHVILLLAWLVVLAVLFSQVEIQVEGARGWATGLPTWRIADAPFLRLFFGGREITGYHVFVFSFMFAVFHLPLFMARQGSLRLEARILGGLMLFWILEDALWFAMNPAYGLARLTPKYAPWHPHWLLGVPVDYLVFPLLAAVLLWWSFGKSKEIRESDASQSEAGSGAEKKKDELDQRSAFLRDLGVSVEKNKKESS